MELVQFERHLNDLFPSPHDWLDEHFFANLERDFITHI